MASSSGSGPYVALAFGIVLFVPGVIVLARPREAAHANDTKGPAWVRNYNRAPGQKTTPLNMVLLGSMLVLVGGFLLVLAVLDLAGVIHLS